MHEFILPSPLNMTVDHKDNNGLNNQKFNLRHVTIYEQRHNMVKMSDRKGKKLTSNFKGVSWSKDKFKWAAQICINGKQTYIGRYDFEIDAARAYNRKAREVYGEFARLNVMPVEQGKESETHGNHSQIC